LSNRNVDRMKSFIEALTPKLMMKGKIPGLSIAVVQGREVIYAEGFGARDMEKNLPATPDTLCGIGSCTKSFVATAIMQLVEKGKINLDDRVDQYVPLKIGSPEKPITIHHLLTHSAGIPSLGTSTVTLYRGLGVETGIPLGGVNDFYRFLNDAGDEIADEPGKRFFYFNAGFRMLGHIIQEVSGMAFDAYVTENILKPLEMRRTTLSKAQYEMDPNRMTPYWKKLDGTLTPTGFPYQSVAGNPDFSFLMAAGGIISSVMELTNYLIVNMEKGKFKDIRILSAESVERMQRLHIEYPPAYFGKCGYGYGWRVTENFLGYKLVSHEGDIYVSTAHIALIPTMKIGIALASNIDGFPHPTVAQGIFAALMGKKPEKVILALRIQERMEMLTGTYSDYKELSRVEVVNKGGLLYLKQKNPFTDSCVPLIPEDDSLKSCRFYILSDGVRQPLEFAVQSPEKIDLYVERHRYHKIVA
jgi:CubicO group peptidase (beta-lactamase class C family)